MVKGKKKTDPTLSAIIIEDRAAKHQLEEEKHERRKSKVSYFKGPNNILNDPSNLNIVTTEQIIQPSQSVLSNIMIQEQSNPKNNIFAQRRGFNHSPMFAVNNSAKNNKLTGRS